jgi:excisionase family DNA binding protein
VRVKCQCAGLVPHAPDTEDAMTSTQPVPDKPFPPTVEAATYDADDLAALLKCSVRKIWRMRDANELPACLRLGRLVRWPKAVVDSWIHSGSATTRR